MTIDTIRDAIIGSGTEVPVIGGTRRYTNFDNAASTPVLAPVLDAIGDFMPWYSSVHRGNGYKSRLSTAAYDRAHQIALDFVGANEDEHVALFGKNTTEAINKLSYRLPLTKKDIVLISHLEHHSNDLPWRARATVVRIGLNEFGEIDTDDYLRLLEKYAGRVKLVAISGASNVTGHIPDIHWFASKAHSAGADIAVDAAQLAAHRPIHMKRLSDHDHIDYVAISAHKMYAPFGTGVLIGRRDTFERGEPEYRGGGTINVVTTDTIDWAPPPDRDEAGSPNVVGAVALARSMVALKAIGFDAIIAHEIELTNYALNHLKNVPMLQLYGEKREATPASRAGVIPFCLDGQSHFLTAAILGYEWGIGVRSGCFCAHPYVVKLLGLDTEAVKAVRSDMVHDHREGMPGLVRISFAMYNTKDEVDLAVAALTAITSGKHDTYLQDRQSGEFTPKNYSFKFPGSFSWLNEGYNA